MFIDLRSKEIAKWRKKAKVLAAQLDDWKENAEVNEGILLLLHQAALLLIAREKNWQIGLEALLKKRLSLQSCALLKVSGAAGKNAAAAKLAKSLPAGGRSSATALLATAGKSGKPSAAARSYFYLPIKKQRRTVAVLVLVSRHQNAFPPDAERDFVRRLSALIAAAL